MYRNEAFRQKVRIPHGIDISRPEVPGPEVSSCLLSGGPNASQISSASTAPVPSGTSLSDSPTWSYLFIHHAKVKSFAERLALDGIPHFIHRSVRYERDRHSRGVREVEHPTISGLIFLQGPPRALQAYLGHSLPGYHLVNDCASGLPAVIADTVMRPFMRVLDTSPERIRFLLRPFHYYAGGNTLLRITSGFLAGLEGYVVRIDRDRRLVLDVGGMSVAISGVHCEKFEVVEREIF